MLICSLVEHSVVTRDTQGQMYMAHMLNIIISTPDEKEVIKEVIDGLKKDKPYYVLNLVQALLMSCDDWDLIFKSLDAVKQKGDIKPYDRDGVFHGALIGSMEAVVWLKNKRELTDSNAELFFKFLLEFLRGSAHFVNQTLDKVLSGRLSNLAPELCRLPQSSVFFKGVTAGERSSECIKQVVSELCLKRFVGFSLEDKVKICSVYPK